MIPVLVCPVVSRFELLERMLRSIDEPIGRIVIVDNSLSGYIAPFDDLPIAYIRPLIGLGYPGGINAGIAQTPGAPWWLWASADLVWGPGDLARIAGLMDAAPGPRSVTGSHRGLRNVYGAMNRAAIELVGLFDEWSFYPIYFDDDDMERRCRLAGVEWLAFDGAMRHDGSATIGEDRFRDANARTFGENRRRYVEKWGGPPGGEAFATPWNLAVPVSFVRPDPGGRAARLW
jgi:GT2 family glycosyltransferase